MPITISQVKSNAAADYTGLVTLNNQSGGTTTAQGTDLIRPSDWNSAHTYTIGLSASEIASIFAAGSGLSSTTAAGGITFGAATSAYFEPFPLPNTNSTLSAPVNGSLYIDGPYEIPNGLGKGVLNVLVSNAAGYLNGSVLQAAVTGSVTAYQTFYDWLALYSQGAGANTTRLESVWTGCASILATWTIGVTSTSSNQIRVSNQLSLSFPSQFDSTGGQTYGTTSQSKSLSSQVSTWASTTINSFISTAAAYVSGARMDIIALSNTIAPGIYWLGHLLHSTSSTTGTGYGAMTAIQAHSRLGLLENLVNAYRRQGSSASNSSTNMQPFHGYFATTSTAPVGTINTSDIRGTTGRIYWNFQVTTA